MNTTDRTDDMRHSILAATKEELVSLARLHDPRALVHGRIKSLDSMALKKHLGRLRSAAHLDSIGVRLIVATTAQCYHLFDELHRRFGYLQSECDDYIAAPKPNGYRSLHTVIVPCQDHCVEVQVRTHDMHRLAEHGTAAHHLYKLG